MVGFLGWLLERSVGLELAGLSTVDFAEIQAFE